MRFLICLSFCGNFLLFYIRNSYCNKLILHKISYCIAFLSIQDIILKFIKTEKVFFFNYCNYIILSKFVLIIKITLNKYY